MLWLFDKETCLDFNPEKFQFISIMYNGVISLIAQKGETLMQISSLE